LEERRARALAQREPLGQSLAGIEDARSKLEQRIAELRGPLDACLKPAAGDPSAALTRMEKARELRGRIAMTAAACESILRARGADGGDDLRVKLEESRQNCAGATERIRALEERYALFHELADADPEELQRRYADLEERAGRMEQEAQALDHEYATMREQVADARAEGRQARNAAVLETEVQNLAHEQAALTRERGACGIAFTTLQEAAERFSQTHRERLEQRVSQIFRRISLNAERTIRLKEDFEIEILDGGRPCAIRQLSQGARDQLALALRLAVAELLSEERRLPLLFDDPFLSFDPKRLEEMRGTLAALAEERQIVLLSHRAEQAGWGHRIAIE
jgi:chromosome segregation protein